MMPPSVLDTSTAKAPEGGRWVGSSTPAWVSELASLSRKSELLRVGIRTPLWGHHLMGETPENHVSRTI